MGRRSRVARRRPPSGDRAGTQGPVPSARPVCSLRALARLVFLLSVVCACTVAVTLDSLTASDRECSFSLSIVRYEIERKSERGRGTVDGNVLLDER